MKITTVRSRDTGKRMIKITCNEKERNNAAPVMAFVIGEDKRLVTKHDHIKKRFIYYFNIRYLEDMLMAFPLAEKSDQLQRRLDRQSDKYLKKWECEPFDIPGLWDRKYDKPCEPFDYQWAVIRRSIDFLMGDTELGPDELDFMNNDQVGLGKSLMTLAALLWVIDYRKQQGLDTKVLVVAPKNGKYVWERENNRWAGLDYVLPDAGEHTLSRRIQLINRQATLTIVNPEMIRAKQWKTGRNSWEFKPNLPHLFDKHYDIIVLDEYHRFGSPTSQQSVGMLGLHGDAYLPLSGTPYINRPEQLWPVLHRCWPDLYPDYDQYKGAISIYQQDLSGRLAGYNPKVMLQIKEFMLPRSIRRRKDQVMEGLPEEQIIQVIVELSKEQRRLYNRIKEEFLLELEQGAEATVFNVMVQIGRLRQACFSPELYGGSKNSIKLDMLKQDVADLVESGQKAIVFSQWSKGTRILERELKQYNPAYVDGTVKGRDRVKMEDKFNLDEDCHLYIGTIGANKESISLGAATYVLFPDRDWSPMINEQARGRSAAGGLRGLDSKVDKVTVIEYLAKDTYEEHEEMNRELKHGFFKSLIETDGGKKVTKSMVRNLREML